MGDDTDSISLSLVIPTFNRPHFLARLLRYLQDIKFRHEILVADSSFAGEAATNKRIVESASKSLNIVYRQHNPTTSLDAKMAETLRTSHAAYVGTCADDDFVVPHALESCARFLNANRDYEVAHGHSLFMFSVRVEQNKRSVTKGAVTPEVPMSRLWTIEHSQRTLESDDPLIRLREHLLDYRSTFYSVHRLPTLVRNLQMASKLTHDLFFGELLPDGLCAIQGKMKLIDLLYAIRPYHALDQTNVVADRLDLPGMLTSPDFSMKYSSLRNCLAEELAEKTSQPKAEARKALDELLTQYIVQYLQPKFGSKTHMQRNNKVMSRFHKIVRLAISMAENAASLHQLIAFIESPLDFAVCSYAFQSDVGYAPVRKILYGDPKGSRREDFQRVYDYAMRYPYGIHSKE